MKTGFKDPIGPTEPIHKVDSPWNFDAPPYDQRTSCFVSAGTKYGVGHRAPVGSLGGAKPSNVIPKGRVETLKLYERNDKREIIRNEEV
jgi:hypothetical protein